MKLQCVKFRWFWNAHLIKQTKPQSTGRKYNDIVSSICRYLTLNICWLVTLFSSYYCTATTKNEYFLGLVDDNVNLDRFKVLVINCLIAQPKLCWLFDHCPHQTNHYSLIHSKGQQLYLVTSQYLYNQNAHNHCSHTNTTFLNHSQQNQKI